MSNSDHQRYHGRGLLVEDDPFMRQAVAGFLTNLGFEVDSASDYAQAMSLLERASIGLRLAVVDLSLPEQGDEDVAPRKPLGLAIARHIKQTRRHAGVLIWSAYTHHLADILALIEDGHRGLAFVPKGSRAETLRRAVSLVMEGDVYLPAGAIARTAPGAVERFLQALRPDVAHIVREVELRLNDLAPRHIDIATRFALRPEAIASELGLETKTIRNYSDNLYEALGLKEDFQGMRRDSLIVLAVLLRRLQETV